MSKITPEGIRGLSVLAMLAYIADLLLLWDGSEEAVKVRKVRLAWYLMSFSLTGHFLISMFAPHFILRPFESVLVTATWRIFNVAAWSWIIGVTVLLAYTHYRYLLVTGRDLRFTPILFFFVSGVASFGYLYSSLYVLSPGLYYYPEALVVPGPLSKPLVFPTSYLFAFDFHLYSACTAVSIGYPRIASSSAVVSLINFIEVIGSILLLSIVVATFVNKTRTARS